MPHMPSRSIVTHEREVEKRWWTRQLKQLRSAVRERGADAFPADLVGFAGSVSEKARARFHEVTPQMTLALICGEQLPGFHTIPNLQGLDNLRQAAVQVGDIFRQSGNFPRLFGQDETLPLYP